MVEGSLPGFHPDMFGHPPSNITTSNPLSSNSTMTNDSPSIDPVTNDSNSEVVNNVPETVSVNKLVVNEVLCYLQHNLNKYSTTNVKGTMSKFYTECEIQAAKELLFNIPLVSGLVPSHSRKGNNKKFREIDDIVSVFLVIDEKMLISSLPTFAAVNLSRIPTYTHEEENVGGILARLSSLEKEFTEWKQVTTCNNNKLAELQRKDTEPVPLPPPTQIPATSARTFANALNSGIPVLKTRPDGLPLRPVFRSRIVSLAESEGSIPKRRREELDDDVSENGWQNQKPKRRGKTGKRENCTLSGGEALFDIFVSHLNKTTGTDELSDFLAKESIKVISIRKTSHVEANFASFKVKIERKHYDKLCGEDAPLFWPVNVMCRPFVDKKVDKSSGGTIG
jgi:hypothetical protein